jgi:hypothetical protein
MGADETAIIEYLKTFPDQFVSGKQIALKATSRRRFDKEPGWALPVLLRMSREGVLEADSNGAYCLVPEDKHKKHKDEHKLSKEAQEALEKAAATASAIDLPETGSSANPG